MKTYYRKKLSSAQLVNLCKRKAISFEAVTPIVQDILSQVKKRGDAAVREYTKKFDGVNVSSFAVTKQEITLAYNRTPREVRQALKQAIKNITKFHKAQMIKGVCVETMPGVSCFAQARAIERVGLYIPGGTAPLPSTVLMLAIPAMLAGCTEIALATPPQRNGTVPDVILCAAKLCGIATVYKVGGAQAIAALAYGTQSIAKVDKVFGPGNQYVTAAKMLVSIDPNGAAIDMPAGPTEVLVIADKSARADFVASDLLSQAEHGKDSQAILVCTDKKKTAEILAEVQKQLVVLPRKEIAVQALRNSFALVVNSLDEAVAFSNRYAPEHLAVNADRAASYVKKIKNAGSVFLGAYSCEAAGDYASGTNHALPTYGYARVYGGVSVASFQKNITFQQITKKGAKNVGPTISLLAAQEGLGGHKRAMELRYK